MAKTRHMQARMSQRGIDQELIDLVGLFGKSTLRGDIEKQVLNRKGVDTVLSRLDQLRSNLIRMRDKGGVVVVCSQDGAGITTYNLNSYRRGVSQA